MKPYERPKFRQETRNKIEESGVEKKEDREEEKEVIEEKATRNELPPIDPDFQDDGYQYFDVGMFDTKMIKVEPDIKVELQTEGLATCTALVVLGIRNESKDRYALLSHSPYYHGPFYDESFLQDELGRYPELKDEDVRKQVFIFIPYAYDGRLDIESITDQLEPFGITGAEIVVKKHAPSRGGKAYEKYDGKVRVVFEKRGNIWIQHMAPGSVKHTEVDLKK